MRRTFVVLLVMWLSATGCESAPASPAPATLSPNSTLAPLQPTSPAQTSAASTPPQTAASVTPRATALAATATPAEPSGTVFRDDGQNRVLSHAAYFWTLTLPRDWLITNDSGFQLKANDPQKSAFVSLLSQMWENEQERQPDARAYVEYWKHSIFGNVFPIEAEGTQLSETEISKDKFGGPYLRYEFDDAKKGVRYIQLYASGGGPNALVVTTWAKRADMEKVRETLERILNSAALVKAP